MSTVALKSTTREKQNSYIHLCYTRKDYSECLRVIEEQLKLCNGQSEYPLYVKALILRNQGKIEESLTAFQAALCLNPMNVNNLKQVGRSLYLLGKHKTALGIFEEAEQIVSEDREIWHNKGLCYLYLKQYDHALENFETANSIAAHEQTYLQMGRVYRLMGQEEEALRVYMEALEIAPENPEILTTIGLMHLKLGRSSQAFESLGNALTYDPRNPKTILAAASIIQDNQDVDVALVKYRVAATQTPHSAQLWNNIAMCFFGKGKLVAAAACLKRASYLSPFEWIVAFNLGVVLLSSGQFASAFHHLSTAINLFPSYPRSYSYLALALARLEDFENACAAYDKAIELWAGAGAGGAAAGGLADGGALNLADGGGGGGGGGDYTTHLNYAVTLYKNDELERARVQFSKYEELVVQANADGGAEIDSDVTNVAESLKKALKA